MKIQSFFTTSKGIIHILKYVTVLEHGIILKYIFPLSIPLRLEVLTNSINLFPDENWAAMMLRIVFWVCWLSLSSRGGSWICLFSRSRTAFCPPWSAVAGTSLPLSSQVPDLREVTAIERPVFPQMTRYFLLFERNTKEGSELLPLGPKSAILPNTNHRSCVCLAVLSCLLLWLGLGKKIGTSCGFMNYLNSCTI